MKDKRVKRGEIYMVGPVDAVGSEQHGDRPGLIVQSDELNRCSPTTVICFITSQLEKGGVSAHVRLPGTNGLTKRSMVLTEKVREIDKVRLGAYIGKIDPQSMDRVDRALKYTLDIGGSKHHEKQK